MKKIYIVLTHTGTPLSKLIRWYTKNEYTHSSIALDEDLEELYSFGRKNPYIAFIGGLVKESLTSGTFKRFKHTQTSVYELPVTDFQYEKIKNKISEMYNRREKYKFNTKGLFAVSLNKKIIRENTFYCAEFVKYILQNANIDVRYLPEIIKPEDFKKVKNVRIVYKGKLNKYRDRIREIEAPKQTIKTIPIPRRAVI